MCFIDVKMYTIKNYKILKYVTYQNNFEIPMENMKETDTEQQQTKPQNVISILN